MRRTIVSRAAPQLRATFAAQSRAAQSRAAQQLRATFAAQSRAGHSRAEQSRATFTAHGSDRVGAVKDLVTAVSKYGGNVESTDWVKAGGQYACVFVVQASDHRAIADEMRLSGARVTVSTTKAMENPVFSAKLHIAGGDTTDIIYEAATCVLRHGIQFDRLTSSSRPAPHGGAEVFEMHASLFADDVVDVDALRDSVEDMEDRLQVDMTLCDVLQSPHDPTI